MRRLILADFTALVAAAKADAPRSRSTRHTGAGIPGRSFQGLVAQSASRRPPGPRSARPLGAPAGHPTRLPGPPADPPRAVGIPGLGDDAAGVRWMQDNAWKFGFVMSLSQGEECPGSCLGYEPGTTAMSAGRRPR